jgi:hypothetical protein
MSLELQTCPVDLWRDDKSGLVGHSVCDSGRLMEEYMDDGDINEPKFSSQLTASRPEHLKPLEDSVGIDGCFIHQRFQALGTVLQKK